PLRSPHRPPPPRPPLFPYTTLFRSRWPRTTERTGARLASPPSRPEPRSTDFVRPPPGPERPARAPTNCGRSTSRSTREPRVPLRSEEHTSELQSLRHLVCRLLLDKK